MKIKIDHIAKIEGHAGFAADIINGDVAKARMIVYEGARLLEGILRDRHYYEVSQISARICGICPVVHTLTSLMALEAAMNITISQEAAFLRRLLMLGQLINSHALHIFFFSLADFFEIENDLDLIAKEPEKTSQAISIRNFGNEIIEIIGGRSIHPLTPCVGGFTKWPENETIKKIGETAKKILPEAIALADFFAQLNYPDFSRPTDFVSLADKKEYAIYSGDILLGGAKTETAGQFMPKIIEQQIEEDGVKRSSFNNNPYMVGAIARLNNNFKNLNPEAKKIWKKTKLKLPSQNTFHNILAQAVEIVHCLEEVIGLTKKIPAFLQNNLNRKIQIKAGKGTGAVEAPRGTLFYFYEVGNNGLIKNCNIITPTAQNLARLEKDLEIWLPQLKKQGLDEDEIKKKIKMLIRAYDPCLTCATH